MRFERALVGVLGCALMVGCIGQESWLDYDEVVYGGVPRAGDAAVVMFTPGCSGQLIAELLPDGTISPQSSTFVSANHCISKPTANQPNPGPQYVAFGQKPDTMTRAGFIEVTNVQTAPGSDLIVAKLATPAPVAGVILNGVDPTAPPAGVTLKPEGRVVGYGTNNYGPATNPNTGATVTRHVGYGEKRAAGLAFVGVDPGFQIQGQQTGPLLIMDNTLGTMICPGDSGGFTGMTFTVNGQPVEVFAGVNQSIRDPQATQQDPTQCTRATTGHSVRVDKHIQFIEAYMAGYGAKPAVFTGTIPPQRPTAPGEPGTPGAPPQGGTPGTPGAPDTGGGSSSGGGISGGCSAAAPSAVALPLMYVLSLFGLSRRRRRRK